MNYAVVRILEATRKRYHIYSSKRHIRPHRTSLFSGLGLRVGVLGVVMVWVRVSIRVRVGVAIVRGYGQGQFGVRVRVGWGYR